MSDIHIELFSPEQKVGGSNPLGRTTKTSNQKGWLSLLPVFALAEPLAGRAAEAAEIPFGRIVARL